MTPRKQCLPDPVDRYTEELTGLVTAASGPTPACFAVFHRAPIAFHLCARPL